MTDAAPPPAGVLAGALEITDISQPLTRATAVWPGDRPLDVEWTLRRDAGASVNLAAITMSVHAGTHVDGPYHSGDGPVAGALPLGPFVGPAAVLDARPHVNGDPPLVGTSVLEDLEPGVERVLLRTRESADATTFPSPFAALAPDLCRGLVERGCVLVGTDAPSVDPVDSTALVSHRVLAEAGVPNVENLVLSGVEPGWYGLVALPLPLGDADSAPVRAVLIREGGSGQ